MARQLWVLLLLVSVPACQNSANPTGKSSGNGDQVTLLVVKQDGYVKTLEGLRGKIVVVDIWGEF